MPLRNRYHTVGTHIIRGEVRLARWGPPPPQAGVKRKLDIFASNLSSTLHFMAEDAGHFAFACDLDPRSFGGAQSRRRCSARSEGPDGSSQISVGLACAHFGSQTHVIFLLACSPVGGVRNNHFPSPP